MMKDWTKINSTTANDLNKLKYLAAALCGVGAADKKHKDGHRKM